MMKKAVLVLILAVAVVGVGWNMQPTSTGLPANDPGAVDAVMPISSTADDAELDLHRRVPVLDSGAPGEWVAQLLYGEDDGALGYVTVISALQDGALQRRMVGCAVLEELVRDNAERARLRNVLLPVALLAQDLHPTAEVCAVRANYLEMTANSPLHGDLMRRLESWPVDAATAAKIADLLGALDAFGSVEELRKVMEQLLALGPTAASALASGIVVRVARDGTKAMPLVFALLDAQAKPEVLGLLLFDTAATQWREGTERASGAVSAIGVAFRTYLGGGLGNELAPERALAITRALIDCATNARVEQAVGLGVTTAISLGGGTHDDPARAQFLASASRSWPALAGNTALVNLGYVASPQDFLAYVPWPLSPPTDRERMVRHGDYLTGLTAALRRHPDQADHVVPYITETLRRWQSSSFEVLMCEHVMRLVREMDIRQMAPVLEELRNGQNKRLAKQAAKILDGWK
ncbi:MAG: hypothetical protein ABL997_13975 [Planctomycetota bacterium]